VREFLSAVWIVLNNKMRWRSKGDDMKRILVLCMAMFFVFSFAVLSFASVDSIYEVAVVGMSGDVQVDTNGDGIWIRPWVGMKLMEKALIKTGDNSTTDIVFDAEGLNVVRIKPNTLTTVKKALLELSEGEMFANFANLTPGSSFTIKTPTAACSIRGSFMGVSFRNGITTAMSRRGDLYVQGLDANGNPKGSPKTIPEGKKTNVDGGGNVGDTEDLDDSDTEEFDDVENETSGGGTGTGTGVGELDDVTDQVDTKDIDEIKDISPSN
jgi:hypothetical protein